MTKAKISEYDAVASNNTDVNGVNIAEGCPPSGMNNMGREIMAALKRFQVGSDGDGVTVGGNLVVSGSSTVNTFTAGPVSATTLNTSGAVVFNDAGADVDFRVEGDTDANLLFVDASADRFGVGTGTPSAKLHVSGGARIADSTNSANYITIGSGNEAPYGNNSIVSQTGSFSIGTVAASTNLILQTAGAEKARIDSSGNVGIGLSSPNGKLSVAGNITLEPGGSGPVASSRPQLWRGVDGFLGIQSGADTSGIIGFYTSSSGTPSERMRIDSSGNLLVAKTSANNTDQGAYLGVDGQISAVIKDAGLAQQALFINRQDSDGTLILFRKANSTVGSIYSVSGARTAFNSQSVAGYLSVGGTAYFAWNTTDFRPMLDNAYDIGAVGARFDDIYATNNVIQTSDRNEKQDIEELSEAETRVAVAAKGLLKKYRWKSAVAEKGDDARIHFGIIAQDLKAAFEAEGLDAGRYAMFIHSEWWETQTEVPAVEAQEAVYEAQTDEEGNEVQVLVSEAVEAKEAFTRTDTYQTEAEAPEGAVRKERMGIRYNELLAFIIAAI